MVSCVVKHRFHLRPASPFALPPSAPYFLYLLYLLCFLLLAHSFAPRKMLSHLFSTASALFAKNHPGVALPSRALRASRRGPTSPNEEK